MCAKITMCDGGELPWVDEIRYLGVFIIRGAKFKCSINKAKRSFYRAANGIFAKIGELTSKEVMVQHLKQKCLPILLHALDVCNLDKRSMQSLDLTFNRFLWSCLTLRHQIWKLCITVKDCSAVIYQAHYWNSVLKKYYYFVTLCIFSALS